MKQTYILKFKGQVVEKEDIDVIHNLEVIDSTSNIFLVFSNEDNVAKTVMQLKTPLSWTYNSNDVLEMSYKDRISV